MPLTRARRRSLTGSALLAVLFAATTCSRSDLYVGPLPPPEPECIIDSDCPDHDNLCEPVRCVNPKDFADLLPLPPPGIKLPPRVCAVIAAIDCDDGSDCTLDTCDLETGMCAYGPATLDLDGDGHRAPLPGKAPGAPDACGDDCNDASELSFPGNPEVCDGVDNDCNGVVDDNATFVPLGAGEVRVSEEDDPYGVGGLAFNGDNYLTVYTSGNSELTMYETMLTSDGTKVEPIESPFTFQNADASGGPVVWVGDRFGVAWQDRRDGNYEAYFAILKPDGSKATADTRLSFANGFSVNVELAWNGNEFIVAWQDDRNGPFEILAQRVSVDGAPIGDNISLSNPAGQDDEAPDIASGLSTIGVVYTNGVPGAQLVRFQSFEQTTLTPVSSIIDLSLGGLESVYPEIVWNDDHYLVTWSERAAPFKAVFATTVSEQGTIITPVTAISQPPGSARSRDPAVLPLGDRALFVYADNRDDAEGRYELYTRMVNADLSPITPEQRLTFAPKDSTNPIATFGPDGDVAVFFKDERINGEDHVWLTRLGCVAGP